MNNIFHFYSFMPLKTTHCTFSTVVHDFLINMKQWHDLGPYAKDVFLLWSPLWRWHVQDWRNYWHLKITDVCIMPQLSTGFSFNFAKGCWCLCSTANQITPCSSMLLKHSVDWLGVFMSRSKPLCLFPIYRARTVHKHQTREEQFAEFNQKCRGL